MTLAQLPPGHRTPMRHARLRAIAGRLYLVPGARRLVRLLLRFALQRLPLSGKNKQRLFNFFADDASSACAVRCSVRVPNVGSVKLDLSLEDDLSRAWYYWGYSGYERGTTRLFRELVPSKSRVFDIGANVGYYAILAAALMEGHGEVHAFEPWPDVFTCLARNASLNHLTCLRVQQLAMSDVDGEACLYLPTDRAWTNASLVRGFTDQDSHVVVSSWRFDSYCSRYGVGPVDLVKIDAEGSELQILRGMGDLLNAWRPDIIMEVLEPFAHELDEFFKGSHYRKFIIRDAELEEVDRLTADHECRDFYLSCTG